MQARALSTRLSRQQFHRNTWDKNAAAPQFPAAIKIDFGGGVGGPIIPKSFLGVDLLLWQTTRLSAGTTTSYHERAVLLQQCEQSEFSTFGGVQYSLNTGPIAASGTVHAPPCLGMNSSGQKATVGHHAMPNDHQLHQTSDHRCSSGSRRTGQRAGVSRPICCSARATISVVPESTTMLDRKWHSTVVPILQADPRNPLSD